MNMQSNNDLGAKNSVFQYTISRPVTITMIMLSFIIFGQISYNALSLNLMPDITYPSLTVRTEFPGAAPEEVETSISRPIEEALGIVTDLFSISSVSKAGQSDVILEFSWDSDIDEAINEVREKLDRVFLPEDADQPLILKFDPSLDPIIRLGLYGGPDLFFDRYIAEEQLKKALETQDGVAAVKVKGGFEEEIRVELDEKKITLLGLDIQQIRQRLQQENINLAGGELKEGTTEYIVRTLNEFRSVEEIGQLRIGFNNNRDIRLSDIGKVYRTHKERQIITRINGRESVELEIYKEGDANIVLIAQQVRERIFGTPAQQAYIAQQKRRQARSGESDSTKVAEKKQSRGRQGGGFPQRDMRAMMTNFLAHDLPQGLQLELLTDQSIFIKNSIDEVKSTAYWGAIFATLVLFLFLNNLSSTVIVGLAIPISIVATFIPMNLFGVTLNIMSLGGLALGIGMLVDNSIVVTESIFRCREEGDALHAAVLRGTREVGSAVTASTITTIAVFLPMIFVEGVAGQIFGDLAVTVVFSLLASLGAALFIIPMLSARDFGGSNRLLKRSEEDRPGYFFGTRSLGPFRDLIGSVKSIFSYFLSSKSVMQYLWRFLTLLPAFIYFIARLLLQLLFIIVSRIFVLIMSIFIGGAGILTIAWTRYLSRVAGYFSGLFSKMLDSISDRYSQSIDWALKHRMEVLMMALIPFALTVFLLLPNLGQELIPEVHQGEFDVRLTLPIGTPVETTTEIIEPVESYLLSLKEVEQVSTVAGVDLTRISDSEEGEHTARITVTLKPSNEPLADIEERLLKQIRQNISLYSGISYNITRPVLFSFKTPVEVEIKGFNISQLSSVSRRAVQTLSEIPGLTDVKSSLQRGNPEVQIIYDRTKLAFYDLNIMTVANLVRNKVRGDVATQFKKADRRIDVRVKVREEDKANLARLRALNVNPGGAIPISLESVAKIEINEGPSEIRRINQQRAAVIMANISGRQLSQVSADIEVAMNQVEMPSDFTYEITGQNKEMEVSMNSLRMAILLAIFMVYIVMASQFESFIHPLVILFTVPFALIGVVLMLWILGLPLNIMVFLGFIMLAGIVVNNAIVLVDYINQLRAKNMTMEAAIMTAGKARLRPILMTTATTVLGLLPMAIGSGEGAEIRAPMAITVIAGLISATVLTLIVIPTVYAIFEGSRKTVVEGEPTA